MRFFMNDLYKALRKVSSYQSNRAPAGEGAAQQANFAKELGRMMQEILHSALGTYDLQTILEDGRMLYIFNNMVNKGNRFGLVMRLESSEILRASQTYMTLVEALGRRKEVIPVVFTQVVSIVEREHPEVRTEGDEPMSIAQALETINRWLERVAARDPALFDKLLRRIKLQSTKQPKSTPANNDSEATHA